MSIPKIVAAETPGRGLMWYLVDESLDFVPEVKLFLDWKAGPEQNEEATCKIRSNRFEPMNLHMY